MRKRKLSLLIIIVLICSMFINILGVQVNADVNSKYNNEEFVVISPQSEQTVAAGYIDICWNDAKSYGTVKNYKVYIDGILHSTTRNMKYEYYSTKVYFHRVKIVAEFENGTKKETPEVRFGISKKGLAIEDNMGAKVINPDVFGASWYYNWGRGEFDTSNHTGYEKIL